MTEPATVVPEWAEKWLPGHCDCGARLCRPICWCGDHVACSANGTSVEQCQTDRQSGGTRIVDHT